MQRPQVNPNIGQLTRARGQFCARCTASSEGVKTNSAASLQRLGQPLGRRSQRLVSCLNFSPRSKRTVQKEQASVTNRQSSARWAGREQRGIASGQPAVGHGIGAASQERSRCSWIFRRSRRPARHLIPYGHGTGSKRHTVSRCFCSSPRGRAGRSQAGK